MTEVHPFVRHLQELRENRGALAALRRGLGQPPGTVSSMYPYIVPWLKDNTPPSEEAAYYLIAALYAYHPQEGGVGNMGDHFWQARDPTGDMTALERRFTALLAAHPDDLAFYLRQAVSYLKSKEVPIEWSQLLADVLAWDHPERYVQRRWARSFWSHPTHEDPSTSETHDQ